jgi:hypothetical protein
MALTVATAGTGVARTSHYVTPTGASAPIQTLLLEPQRTNVCIRSEEFDTWTQTSCVVTANASVAPDGTTTADLITPSADTNGRVRRTVTFTTDAEKCIAVYLKAGTSTRSRFTLRDTTVGTDRVSIRISWSAGVPTPAAYLGSGTIYPAEALANGWYRISVSAVGVIAANTNELAIFADDSAGTGTVYAWGAQAEDAIVPSSYIKTEGTTVTRNADSLYFPFTVPPQAMTVYVRSVNRGLYTASTLTRYAIQIGPENASTDPRFVLYVAASGTMGALYDDGTTQVLSTSGSAQVLGTIVEHLGQLSSDWKVTIARAYDGGAVTVGTQSAASGASVAWSAPRLYLTNTVNLASAAFTHVIVAAGEQSMATMRSLAGVA